MFSNARKPSIVLCHMRRQCHYSILGFILIFALRAGGGSVWAISIEDYLGSQPQDYDPDISRPEAGLGHELGEWHARHDLLHSYFRTLAAESDRVEMWEYARSHEGRPLSLVAISSPENIEDLESLRERHVAAANGEEVDGKNPVVVWLAYSVHGNESSGANAAPAVGYHLAASRENHAMDYLDNTIVLIDPCLNPDGLSRFAQWANSFRGARLIGDPAHIEHNEVWPGGRGNHYWFDLNRDWLLLTHPESRGRIEQFHRWRPNILADFHEMGSDATYFFQPGVPSRQNPNTPTKNLDLTRRIARFHADSLDAKGRLYYTEERFDDFYYGKGSTYPDAQGTIGVLFEQASSRGHLKETQNGELSFPFTIENQIATSFSTLDAASALGDDLLAYQAGFSKQALIEAGEDSATAYVVDLSHAPVRGWEFVDILSRHQIEVYELSGPVTLGNHSFSPEVSIVIPVAQRQYRLIKSLFERRKSFEDHTFYDVSTWNLPFSFGLPYETADSETYRADWLGERLLDSEFPVTEAPAPDAYAYAVRWDTYNAPRTLARLQAGEIRVYVATDSFEAETNSGTEAFGYGTLVVPMGGQRGKADLVAKIFEKAGAEGVRVVGLVSGLTPRGIDLGSPSMKPVPPIRPLALIGGSVSAYEAGEVWHYLDRRVATPLTMVEADRLRRVPLDEYTHLILVSGAESTLSESMLGRIESWARGGGIVIALGQAVTLFEAPAEDEPEDEEGEGAREAPDEVRYADFESWADRDLIRGSIFEAKVDRSHPLGYGFARKTLPVFRNKNAFLELDEDPFANPVVYTNAPWLCGYISDENLQSLRGTAVVVAKRVGSGAMIRMVDNPNFRGVWYGTNRLFANALFFGPIIKSTKNLWSDR